MATLDISNGCRLLSTGRIQTLSPALSDEGVRRLRNVSVE